MKKLVPKTYSLPVKWTALDRFLNKPPDPPFNTMFVDATRCMYTQSVWVAQESDVHRNCIQHHLRLIRIHRSSKYRVFWLRSLRTQLSGRIMPHSFLVARWRMIFHSCIHFQSSAKMQRAHTKECTHYFIVGVSQCKEIDDWKWWETWWETAYCIGLPCRIVFRLKWVTKPYRCWQWFPWQLLY